MKEEVKKEEVQKEEAQKVEKEMTKEQALNLVAQVCVNYKGTLSEHQSLQKALSILAK